MPEPGCTWRWGVQARPKGMDVGNLAAQAASLSSVEIWIYKQSHCNISPVGADSAPVWLKTISSALPEPSLCCCPSCKTNRNWAGGSVLVAVLHRTKMHIRPGICFFSPINCKINTHKYVYVNGPEKQLVHQSKGARLALLGQCSAGSHVFIK